MTTVEIEYCLAGDSQGRAEDVQHALLTPFGKGLDAVTLVTGDHGNSPFASTGPSSSTRRTRRATPTRSYEASGIVYCDH